MSRAWWRRNAVALAAAAVLVPLTAVVIGGNEWWGYWGFRPVFPTTVAVGETIDYAGAEWGPAKVDERPSSGELPAGTKVIEVEVPVTPGDDQLACLPPTLRELGGAGRQWQDASIEVGADLAPDGSTSCGVDGGGPFTLAVAYLVPTDAVGPFGLELSISDKTPGFLRLVVAP